MKGGLLILVVALAAILVIAASSMSYELSMPLIFDGGVYYDTPTHVPTLTSTVTSTPSLTPTATRTNTPRPPTPAPTPTPTITNGEGGESWIFAGYAKKDGSGTLFVGLKPGYCYYVKLDHYENDGKLAVMKSQKIKMDTWPCVHENYNPDAPWPPPEFPVPTILPPPFGYGESFVITLPRNVRDICGYCETCDYFTLNCLEVK